MQEQSTSDEKPYIAMYDVRGIQGYIYKTNKLKEIVAASLIVENIFIDSIKDILKNLKEAKEITSYSTGWEGKKYKEPENGKNTCTYDAEVLFIGGGNAFVLYSSGKLCGTVNKMLAKEILDKTYSMQLACASKEKSGDYYSDYNDLMQQMGIVKGKMPMTHTFNALPVVQTDPDTGYPIVERLKETYDNKTHIMLLSEESRLKREAARKYEEKHPEIGRTEKIFDHMVTEKGKDSFLAVVHIDGNSMGKNIARLMKKNPDAEDQTQNTYASAVNRMRTISYNIKHSFGDVYNEMEAWAVENTVLNDGRIPIRRIICAGDDITFVCNGSMALDCAEFFLSKISKKYMYHVQDLDPLEKNTKQDMEQFCFSACAGIAYFKSHYPFSDAYQAAEECCENAKKRAKSSIHSVAADHGDDRKIGNWLDFQICLHISSSDLKQNRKKNYQIFDGTRLERRPYYVPYHIPSDLPGSVPGPEDQAPDYKKKLDDLNKPLDFSIFKTIYRYFNDREKIPSGLAKNIRDTYSYGKKEMEGLEQFARSRMIEFPQPDGSCKESRLLSHPYVADPDQENSEAGEEMTASWYDALELQDLYADIYKREG